MYEKWNGNIPWRIQDCIMGTVMWEVIFMAKKGMKRFERQHIHPDNAEGPVPQLQGKQKTGKKKANPIIAGTFGPELKVWHEKPIPAAYSTIDTDLARDNLENDMTMADLQDL